MYLHRKGIKSVGKDFQNVQLEQNWELFSSELGEVLWLYFQHRMYIFSYKSEKLTL